MTNENQRIERSWTANAAAWTAAVRERKIESRRVATDAAILDVVLDRNPRTVLDLGCGEGWLSRELAARGVDVLGVDASPALIEAAQSLGGGTYRVLSYDSFIAEPSVIDCEPDVIVANFSLFEEHLEPLMGAIRASLSPSGALVVQTVHPSFANDDGWQVETFAGVDGEWRESMPWYFRTLESWTRLFTDSDYAVTRVVEPLHPEHCKPVSIIFVCCPM